MSKFTPGPWRLVKDEDGPGMIFHPKLGGVAIASLTAKGMPKNGFLGQKEGPDRKELLAERRANANLIAAAPELFIAAVGVIAHYKPQTENAADWPPPLLELARAVAKADRSGSE